MAAIFCESIRVCNYNTQKSYHTHTTGSQNFLVIQCKQTPAPFTVVWISHFCILNIIVCSIVEIAAWIITLLIVLFTLFSFTCNWDTRIHWKPNNCVKVALCQMGGYDRFFSFGVFVLFQPPPSQKQLLTVFHQFGNKSMWSIIHNLWYCRWTRAHKNRYVNYSKS